MKTYYFSTLLLIVFILSCSGSSPVISDQEIESTTPRSTYTQPDNAYVLGLWDIYIDPDSGAIDIVPLRTAESTLNINRLIDGPPSYLVAKNLETSLTGSYWNISVDFGFKHPLPGQNQHTAFDVLGVCMTEGNSQYPGPEGFSVSGIDYPRMLNPDGFTRWFNAPEFTAAGQEEARFGYYPGANGKPDYVPTAQLNPYKYFADELIETGDAFEYLVNNPILRGATRSFSINYRRYELCFNAGTELNFQYMFIAHWEQADTWPDPPGDLTDFPVSANADEALIVRIEDSSTVYYNSQMNFGGNVILDISPWDWSAECNESGVMEEYFIRCYSHAWTGPYEVNMIPIDQGDFYNTFHMEISVETLTFYDDLPVWIEVVYPELDYTNEYGIENDASGALTSYFLANIEVSGVHKGWARTWGEGRSLGLTVDKSGNIYTFGYFVNGCDFDPGSGTDIHTSKGWEDFYLTKFDNNGNHVWALTLGGPYRDLGWAVTIDDNDYIYTTGSFQDKVDFDPGPDVIEYISIGDNDVYLSKFDTDGNHIWTRTWGGLGSDVGWGVAVDNSGSCYVTGTYHHIADFDPGPGIDEHQSNGERDIYVIKIDENGDFIWANTFGSNTIDGVSSIAVDGQSNYFITGSFYGTCDFDPGPGVDEHTPTVFEDIFLIKGDANGDYAWGVSWGGYKDWCADFGADVDTDETGNCYVTGQFSQKMDFDPGPGFDEQIGGDTSAFLSKFSPEGQFMWARAWGGVGTGGRGLVVDGFGNVHVTGFFREIVDFDPGPGVDEHYSPDISAGFVNKFDVDGNQYMAVVWGTENQGWGTGRYIALDSFGNHLVTGYCGGTLDFAPSSAPCFNTPDIHEVEAEISSFLIKHGPDGCW